MNFSDIKNKINAAHPCVHCITNPVTMTDTANILLAAGGRAIMASDPAEVEEITGVASATLLNTGVPNDNRWKSFALAGKAANSLGHPVVLDPVGIGASEYRLLGIKKLLLEVHPTIIRCNQEEASILLDIGASKSGGVESSVNLDIAELKALAENLAGKYSCAVLISGTTDAVSDGEKTQTIDGGDKRMRRLTGSGCMLSAVTAMIAGCGVAPYDAAYHASLLWKMAAATAAQLTDLKGGGIGTFHTRLFDAVEALLK